MAHSVTRRISARRLAMYERYVDRLRATDIDRLTKLCKMHLSFLMDLDKEQFEDLFTEKLDSKGLFTPFIRKKAVKRADTSVIHERTIVVEPEAEPAIEKLVTYLKTSDNLSQEGLFRKTGNISRQKELKDQLQKSTHGVNMSNGTYSAHDCATVLKGLLADLSEPVLLERHLNAYLHSLNVDKEEQRLKMTNLLLQMLPKEHYSIAKSVFNLLSAVAERSQHNKMDACNLGTVFAPHMLCPKKFSGSDLQNMSTKMQSIVTYIIENTSRLFQVPEMLALDVINHIKKTNLSMSSSEESIISVESIDSLGNERSAKKHKLAETEDDEDAIDTVVTFAQRRHCDNPQDTEVELAKLYAHVQSLPESAKKRKLMKQFSEANGYHHQVQVRRKHSRSRSLGESIKRRFSKRSKQKSLNVSVESSAAASTSFQCAHESQMVTITSIQTKEAAYFHAASTPISLTRRYKFDVMKPISNVNSMPTSAKSATNSSERLQIAQLTASPYPTHRTSMKNLRGSYMPDGAEAEDNQNHVERPPVATPSSRDRLAPIGGESPSTSRSDQSYAPVPSIRKPLLPATVANTPEPLNQRLNALRAAKEHKNTPPGPKRVMAVIDSGIHV